MMRARVEDVARLGDWAHRVSLRVEGVPFTFAPGQYVSLHMIEGGQPRRRHYSIASSPRADGCFELCIAGAGPPPPPPPFQRGDTVEFSGPHGTFRLREPVDRDCLFVATGSGVSPLRPMLHRALAAGKGNVTLLFGARTEADLLFGEEFTELAADPRFSYEPTLSRPHAGWPGRTGYVQTHLDSILGTRRDLDIYVCGRREMIEAVMAGLIGRGLASEQIHRERSG